MTREEILGLIDDPETIKVVRPGVTIARSSASIIFRLDVFKRADPQAPVPVIMMDHGDAEQLYHALGFVLKCRM